MYGVSASIFLQFSSLDGQGDGGFTGVMGLALVLVIFVIGLLVFWLVPIRLWIAAWAADAPVAMLTLIAMRLRRVPPKEIVDPRISLVKAGLDVPVEKLEGHFLAGGHVRNVVNAMISAEKANIALPFDRAAAIDLAGRNVLEAVQMSVNPKVITTPKVTAMAKDGIQLTAVIRITVRANIDRLVGGAGEETIVARVGEGIISTIGSSNDHKAVLENPNAISKNVLIKGLDAGTAYEILSIDIADVDVGANIGAKLNAERAEADKIVAQAAAEGRSAMARASEQEMQARVVDMQASLVEAEAKVPTAFAVALATGLFGKNHGQS